MKSAGTLYKAVIKPKLWRRMRTAPRDGKPIILRNRKWTYDIVVTWGRLAEHGAVTQDDNEHGWLWEQLAIAKASATAPFTLAEVADFYEDQTEWAPFTLTKQAAEQLDALDELNEASSQH